eukprot:CAMPEP_0197329194 /NCGR_PEP_ID=MMETSP0892-20130614/5538_1 /TAXON_ID=44058 ORGANISM="Aureoumbra lagunensis, Strain CCMP1510" /NCGR_SAMPLE_ID=MMETSP0892 /ASSEMBLY_ACC=CAM_ASM_000538 /LENGTH=156 /DNA_ID=CAMNT_0042825675 /DNA_START=182 /DNA_END=649 /DNA_ORIENTATION=-
MKFYSLLGLREEVRFRTGSVSVRMIYKNKFCLTQARAAWLQGAGMRLELIEVPEYMNPDNAAPDVFRNSTTLGLNHVAIDVSNTSSDMDSLSDFLRMLNDYSEQTFQRSLGLVHKPYQQMIGQDVFELCFIRDPDGVLLELIRYQTRIPDPMVPDW